MTPVDIYRDEAGAWRWRLTAANGEIVATGEGYTSQRDAQRGFTAAQTAAFDVHAADLVDAGWTSEPEEDKP